jgi:hypothetical protein
MHLSVQCFDESDTELVYGFRTTVTHIVRVANEDHKKEIELFLSLVKVLPRRGEGNKRLRT